MPDSASRTVEPRITRVARGVGSGFLWTFVFGCAAVLIVFVFIPRIIGAVPYAVVSGSMEPAIPVGSIVVSRDIPFESIRFGDVITYQVESGEPTVVTHRVTGIDIIDGEPLLRTRGDANSVADPEPVRPEQVRGKVLYHAPWIGYVNGFLSGPIRSAIVTFIGIALIGYALVQVLGAVRARGANSSV